MSRAKQHTNRTNSVAIRYAHAYPTPCPAGLDPQMHTHNDVETLRATSHTIQVTSHTTVCPDNVETPHCDVSTTQATKRNVTRDVARYVSTGLCALLLLLLTACQQEQLEGMGGQGTLLIGSLQLQTATEADITTKANDADLYLEIGTLKTYAPGQIPAAETLDAGSYLIKAYNTAYKEGRSDQPLFYKEQTVTIQVGAVNRIDLVVPMTNFGITLSGEFPSAFTGYKLKVTQGEQVTEIAANQTAYFATQPVSYTLNATDREGNPYETATKSIDHPVAGMIYTLYYTMETKGDILHE